MKQKATPPRSWPGDPEPEFDEDEDDEGLDDLPGMKPRQPRRPRNQKREAQVLRRATARRP